MPQLEAKVVFMTYFFVFDFDSTSPYPFTPLDLSVTSKLPLLKGSFDATRLLMPLIP
jgi:hypothetical protein